MEASNHQIFEYRLVEKVLYDNSDSYDLNNFASFKPDRWDWIALLPSNWVILHQDLITYVYVTCTSKNELYDYVSVEFQKSYLNSIIPGTSLQLVYFSKQKNCIQGISSVFSFQWNYFYTRQLISELNFVAMAIIFYNDISICRFESSIIFIGQCIKMLMTFCPWSEFFI